MALKYQTHAIFLFMCGLVVVLSLLLVGVPNAQAETANSCPEGQIWSLNSCVSISETTCQTGYTYVADHGCVRITENDSSCPNGYVMEGGRCQRAGQACPAGETWRDGSCQVRDEQSCPAGKERVNGSCFQITETVCPMGYSWSDREKSCEERDDNDDDDNDNDTDTGTGTGGSGTGGTSTGGTSPSYILTISDTHLQVDEGCNVTYTVALKTQPTGNVIVTIGDPSNTDVTAEPATLTFTPDNWDVPQTVTVTCKEDDDAVDDAGTITHVVDGPSFNSVPDQDVDVDVFDNDATGVTISPSSLPVDEGSTATYTVKLDSEPTGDVTVTVNPPSNTDVTTDPATLTFTPDNWDDTQAVTVTAQEDDDAVNDTATVTHTVSGADYESVTAGSVTAQVTDNDTAGVTISKSSLSIGEGGTDTYSIRLDTEPTGNVTVTINDPSNTDVTADPAALIFTLDNWDDTQSVTVTAQEDDDSDNDAATVTHSVSGADYESVTAANVTVTVTDNDATASEQNSGGLSQGDSTTTVTVEGKLTRPHTTYTLGANSWHLLLGATSIKIEAFWLEEAGTESGDTEILHTNALGDDAACLTITPGASITRYNINQNVEPPAEPAAANPGSWKYRLRVDWGAVEAGACNAKDPKVPNQAVAASTTVTDAFE